MWQVLNSNAVIYVIVMINDKKMSIAVIFTVL